MIWPRRLTTRRDPRLPARGHWAPALVRMLGGFAVAQGAGEQSAARGLAVFVSSNLTPAGEVNDDLNHASKFVIKLVPRISPFKCIMSCFISPMTVMSLAEWMIASVDTTRSLMSRGD
jgi:hypothetical protein